MLSSIVHRFREWNRREDFFYELLGFWPLFLFFLCTGVSNIVAENYVNARYIFETEPLEDLILDNLPFVENPVFAYLIYAFVPISTFLATIVPKFYPSHGKLIVFNLSTLLLLRCVTIFVTAFPDPHPRCFQRNLPVPTVDYLLFNVNLQYCGDAMYSGSTCVLFLCAMYWQTFGSSRRTKIVYWILAFLGSFMALLTRQHYSVDVVIAIFITLTLWYSVLLFAEARQISVILTRRECSKKNAFEKYDDSFPSLDSSGNERL